MKAHPSQRILAIFLALAFALPPAPAHALRQKNPAEVPATKSGLEESFTPGKVPEWSAVIEQAATRWEQAGWLNSGQAFTRTFRRLDPMLREQGLSPNLQIQRRQTLEAAARLMESLSVPGGNSSARVIRIRKTPAGDKALLVFPVSGRNVRAKLFFRKDVQAPILMIDLAFLRKKLSPLPLGQLRIGADKIRDRKAPILHLDVADILEQEKRWDWKIDQPWAHHLPLVRSFTASENPQAAREAFLAFQNKLWEKILQLPSAGGWSAGLEEDDDDVQEEAFGSLQEAIQRVQIQMAEGRNPKLDTVLRLLHAVKEERLPPAAHGTFDELVALAERFKPSGTFIWNTAFPVLGETEHKPPKDRPAAEQLVRKHLDRFKQKFLRASPYAPRIQRTLETFAPWREKALSGDPSASDTVLLQHLFTPLDPRRLPAPPEGLLAPGEACRRGAPIQNRSQFSGEDWDRRLQTLLREIRADRRSAHLARRLFASLQSILEKALQPAPGQAVSALLPSAAALREMELQILRGATGRLDPTPPSNAVATAAALPYLMAINKEVGKARDPLWAAVQAAALGCVVDFHSEEILDGRGGNTLTQDAIAGYLEEGLRPLPGSYRQLRQRVEPGQTPKKILYLLDRPGEAGLDLVLVKHLVARGHDVMLAARPQPGWDGISGEETRGLLRESRINHLMTLGISPEPFLLSHPGEWVRHVEVLETGSSASPADISWATPEFAQAWQEADIRIVKGPLARELLSGNRLTRDLFFLSYNAVEGVADLAYRPAAGLEEETVSLGDLPENLARKMVELAEAHTGRPFVTLLVTGPDGRDHLQFMMTGRLPGSWPEQIRELMESGTAGVSPRRSVAWTLEAGDPFPISPSGRNEPPTTDPKETGIALPVTLRPIDQGAPLASGLGLDLSGLQDLLNRHLPWGYDYYDGSFKRESYRGGYSGIPPEKPWQGFGFLHSQYIQPAERTVFDAFIQQGGGAAPRDRTYAVILGRSATRDPAGLEEETVIVRFFTDLADGKDPAWNVPRPSLMPGFMKPEEVYNALDSLILDGSERLLDAGSGVGSAVLAASTRVGKATGVELLPVLHQMAVVFKNALAEQGAIDPEKVGLKLGNALDENFSDYDIIFWKRGELYSFQENDLAIKFAREAPPGARLVVYASLRSFTRPPPPGPYTTRVLSLPGGHAIRVYTKTLAAGLEEETGPHHPLYYDPNEVAIRLAEALEILPPERLSRYLDAESGRLHLPFSTAAELMNNRPSQSTLRDNPALAAEATGQVNRGLETWAAPLAQRGIREIVIAVSPQMKTGPWSLNRVVRAIRSAEQAGLLLNTDTVEHGDQTETREGRELQLAYAAVTRSTSVPQAKRSWREALRLAGKSEEEIADIYQDHSGGAPRRPAEVLIHLDAPQNRKGLLKSPRRKPWKRVRATGPVQLAKDPAVRAARRIDLSGVPTSLYKVSNSVGFSFGQPHMTGIPANSFDPGNPPLLQVTLDGRDPHLRPQEARRMDTGEVVYPAEGQIRVYLRNPAEGSFLYRAVRVVRAGLLNEKPVRESLAVWLTPVSTFPLQGIAAFKFMNKDYTTLRRHNPDDPLALLVRADPVERVALAAYDAETGEHVFPRPPTRKTLQKARAALLKKRTPLDEKISALELLAEHGSRHAILPPLRLTTDLLYAYQRYRVPSIADADALSSLITAVTHRFEGSPDPRVALEICRRTLPLLRDLARKSNPVEAAALLDEAAGNVLSEEALWTSAAEIKEAASGGTWRALREQLLRRFQALLEDDPYMHRETLPEFRQLLALAELRIEDPGRRYTLVDQALQDIGRSQRSTGGSPSPRIRKAIDSLPLPAGLEERSYLVRDLVVGPVRAPQAPQSKPRLKIAAHGTLIGQLQRGFRALPQIEWEAIPDDPGKAADMLRQFHTNKDHGETLETWRIAVADPGLPSSEGLLASLPEGHAPVFLMDAATAALFTPAVAAELLGLRLEPDNLYVLELRQGDLGELLLSVYA